MLQQANSGNRLIVIENANNNTNNNEHQLFSFNVRELHLPGFMRNQMENSIEFCQKCMKSSWNERAIDIMTLQVNAQSWNYK